MNLQMTKRYSRKHASGPDAQDFQGDPAAGVELRVRSEVFGFVRHGTPRK
jgi:hypothetical protein